MLVSVLVGCATSAIRVLVRVIRHVIHPLGVGWMVGIRSYHLVLVGESYIRERRTIVGISHLQSLRFYLRVNFSLNPSVTMVSERPCSFLECGLPLME